MGSRFLETLTGYAAYKGGGNLFAFLLHRVTGLGTLLFLTIHITTTALVYFYSPGYSQFMELFHTPLGMLGEMILVFCVIFHGANGLRIAYIDLFKPHLLQGRNSAQTLRVTLITATLLWLPTAVVMGRNLLVHGFGLFGGK